MNKHRTAGRGHGHVWIEKGEMSVFVAHSLGQSETSDLNSARWKWSTTGVVDCVLLVVCLERKRERRKSYTSTWRYKERQWFAFIDCCFSFYHRTRIQNITFKRSTRDKDKNRHRGQKLGRQTRTSFLRKYVRNTASRRIQRASTLRCVLMLFCFTNNKCQMAYYDNEAFLFQVIHLHK